MNSEDFSLGLLCLHGPQDTYKLQYIKYGYRVNPLKQTKTVDNAFTFDKHFSQADFIQQPQTSKDRIRYEP